MSKHVHVHLTTEQRAHLERMIRTGRAAARVQTRARILWLADRSQPDRHTDPQIAAALLCCTNTVGTIRRRCVREGLDAALYDRPRPGAKPKITGDVEAHLTLLACSQPPAGKARWTLQMLADKLVELQLVDSISDVAVMHRLKKIASSHGG
jgi:putative transposase